jgi:hypothetical protein
MKTIAAENTRSAPRAPAGSVKDKRCIFFPPTVHKMVTRRICSDMCFAMTTGLTRENPRDKVRVQVLGGRQPVVPLGALGHMKHWRLKWQTLLMAERTSPMKGKAKALPFFFGVVRLGTPDTAQLQVTAGGCLMAPGTRMP